MNDIVRLCSILDPNADPLQSLMDVPRIYTPFWRSSQANQESKTLGNLVIVDTPGPNEAGDNLRLKGVVEEQLSRSSIVLIVLDFTQLKNEAAEKVKNDVQKVIELRGKENLYVLINKVDQRRDGDMNPEQVQQFVAAEFGIGDAGRVFEISARRAFTSASFLVELQHNPGVNLTEMKTAKALAQEVFGFEWEEKFEEAKVEELQPKAEKLWKMSGFDPFLNGAINALMAEAAPRCIMSALNIARGRLGELSNDVQLRSSAVNKDAEKIQNEIEALNSDLSDLEWCLINLEEEADAAKKSLREKLDLTLKRLSINAEKAIQNYFLDGIAQRLEKVKNSDIKSQLELLDIKARKTLLQPIAIDIFGMKELFPEPFSSFLKYKVALNGRNEFEFNTKQEAEEFTEQLVAEAKQIVEALLYKTIKEIEIKITSAQQNLVILLRKMTKGVIERAHDRLNQAFAVELELPPLLIGRLEADFGKYTIDIVEQQQPFDVIKTVVNFLKKLFNSNHIEVKENRYIVSLEKSVVQFNDSIKIKIQDTELQINQYLDADFQARIGNFLKNLTAYLHNYQNSLAQALKDQSLSLAEREEIKKVLDSFTLDAEKLAKEVEKKKNLHTN